jgi:NADPH-dependent 2,4-dienoyl-CoA reductase/sulfur reductase-like enzyme/nitrite reductase/ring-hydroxylating ferredoxin subunit
MEFCVGVLNDFEIGKAYQVDVGVNKAYLVHHSDGKISAVGARCTHYGAPLVSGVLSEGRVTCPWHGACFNVVTGDIEESPGLDSLPVFAVRIDGDKVYVTAPQDDVFRRQPSACQISPNPSRTVAVVGGGAAGAVACETLRQEGYDGRIVLITQEDALPYDRPKLSKNLAAKKDAIQLRSESFYQDLGIEVMKEAVVTLLNPSTKTIETSLGNVVKYDDVIVATGGRAFNIPVPGHDLNNVFTLRSVDDAELIAAATSDATYIVVIGTGFIGMEAAWYFAKNTDAKITVVSADAVPLDRVFGSRVGKWIQATSEKIGIQFALGTKLVRYDGEGGKANTVVTEAGSFPADMIVVGAGVRLNTSFLKNVELHEPEKSVICNKFMQSSSGIYVAGDIAYFEGQDGEYTRIEHWNVAQNQARAAARNIIGKQEEFNTVPFFWTAICNGSIRYVGHAHTFDEVHIDGDIENEGKFVAYYLQGDKVAAVATMGRDPVAAACSELIRMKKMPTASQIKAGSLDVASLL